MPTKGFRMASTVKKRRLIVAVEGMDKEGKTTWGLSAPGPIALIDMDMGTEGVIEDVARVKKIEVANFDYSEVSGTKEWNDMWDAVMDAFIAATENSKIRSIVWDTHTEAWELERLAHFGKLTQIMPHHYGPPNREMRDLLKRIDKTEQNLILLCKMRAQYVNDKWNGKYERAGWRDTRYFAQENLRVWKDKDDVMWSTLINSRHDKSLDGMVFPAEASNFPTLATLIFPDTEEEDWE